MNSYATVIDFVEQGSSLYVQIEVFDSDLDQHFREEVRFLGDLLYGDLVHPVKSPLTEACRLMVIDYLKKHFGR